MKLFEPIYRIRSIRSKGRLCGFRGRRIRICRQNSGGTILVALGFSFARNLGITQQRFVVQAWRHLHCPFSTLGTFFWVNLSNWLDLKEWAVKEIFKVADFESTTKIKKAPFLVALGSIFAQKFGITREQWVVRARRCLHRVSSRILHRDKELWRKF